MAVANEDDWQGSQWQTATDVVTQLGGVAGRARNAALMPPGEQCAARDRGPKQHPSMLMHLQIDEQSGKCRQLARCSALPAYHTTGVQAANPTEFSSLRVLVGRGQSAQGRGMWLHGTDRPLRGSSWIACQWIAG